MTADDVRARFEAWLLRLGYTSRPERRPSGKYVNGQIQGNWLAWQAAHADLSWEVRGLMDAASMFTPADVALLREAVSRLPKSRYDAGANLAFRFEAALAKFTHQEKP